MHMLGCVQSAATLAPTFTARSAGQARKRQDDKTPLSLPPPTVSAAAAVRDLRLSSSSCASHSW